jgi:hypothetical protein
MQQRGQDSSYLSHQLSTCLTDRRTYRGSRPDKSQPVWQRFHLNATKPNTTIKTSLPLRDDSRISDIKQWKAEQAFGLSGVLIMKEANMRPGALSALGEYFYGVL